MKKIREILLVNPPQIAGGKFVDGYQGTRPVLPPLGIAYIASVLERAGYAVKIFDGMVQEATAGEIARQSLSYDLIGITSITFQALLAYRVCEAVRHINPSIPIVMGGPHVSCLPAEPLDMGLADMTVAGEGEQAMLDIIRALEGGGDPSSVPGVSVQNSGPAASPADCAMIDDLDSLPMPARHLLPMDSYRTSAVRSRRFPALSIISSRGCPMSCSFCFNRRSYRRTVRYHSAERIVEEMQHCVSRYGAKEIHFWDDNFLLNKQRIHRFCDIMESRGLRLPFDCEGTIRSFDSDILRRLRKVGCYSVSYGIESGVQRILDLMQKNTDLEQIRGAVSETLRLGLDARGYFLFGVPTETHDEIMATIEFAKSLKLTDATFSLLVPLPGTEIYDMVLEDAHFTKEYWKKIVLSEISFPKLPLVYYPQGVGEKELLDLHRRAFKIFYFRPRQLLDKARRSLGNVHVLAESLKGLRTLLSPQNR